MRLASPTSALCYFFINWLVPKCWKLKSNTLYPISRPNIYRVFKMLWRTFLKSCTLRTFKCQNVHTFFHYKNDEENYLHQKKTSLRSILNTLYCIPIYRIPTIWTSIIKFIMWWKKDIERESVYCEQIYFIP